MGILLLIATGLCLECLSCTRLTLRSAVKIFSTERSDVIESVGIATSFFLLFRGMEGNFGEVFSGATETSFFADDSHRNVP